MLIIIFLGLALLLIVTVLPGFYLTQQVGPKDQQGPRDNLPEPSVPLGRSRRALANLQETFPIFLTLAILSLIFGEQGWLSLAGGAVYLLGRVAHLICYMRGLSPWRSIAYCVAMLGNALILVPLLGHF